MYRGGDDHLRKGRDEEERGEKARRWGNDHLRKGRDGEEREEKKKGDGGEKRQGVLLRSSCHPAICPLKS